MRCVWGRRGWLRRFFESWGRERLLRMVFPLHLWLRVATVKQPARNDNRNDQTRGIRQSLARMQLQIHHPLPGRLQREALLFVEYDGMPPFRGRTPVLSTVLVVNLQTTELVAVP